LRCVHGLLDLPAEVVGKPAVADLAGASRVIEEGKGLLDGGEGVPRMNLVEVDGVDFEAPST
jgi:hypothetical protein